MKNKGWEFSINAIPVHTKDFEWTVGLNYTATDSKITKLNVVDSESTYVAANPFSIGKFVQVFMVDQTPYTYYMAKQAYDDAGKPLEGQYVQPDGSISNIETRYATGKSALPTSLLGFNTHFSYRNWDLALSGHGAFGNTIYSYVHSNDYKEQVYTDQGTYLNILKYTRDKGFDKQQYYTDYFLEDGSFFRFDNVTLGYTFHKLWNNTSSLQLSLGIQNIATITGYSGIDPELYDGIDRKVYQRPRIYTFSMNLTF
jgi:iron complex outermembrane receptor protein